MRSFIWVIILIVCGLVDINAVVIKDTIPPDSLRMVQLGEVVKVAKLNNKLETATMGLTHLDQHAIKKIPTLFGEPDVIKALQLQPGVSAGIEGFAGMFVRGGNNDENVFLIDGNPIYQMNHLGGLFSAYNADAIENVLFYKAAFPARCGGRLSSVTDISLKSGDKDEFHGIFTIGLTSANISLSGPIIKDKTSFAVAMRRSWLELVSIPALAVVNASKKKSGEKVLAGYSFADFNLKVDHHMERWETLSLLGYYSRDRLKMGDHQFSTDEAEEAVPYLRKNENRLKWGNFLTALSWELPLSEYFSYAMNLSFTRYVSGFKHTVESSSGTEDDYEYSRFYKNVTNHINDIALKASLAYYPSDKVTLLGGANYTRHLFSPEKIDQEATDDAAGNTVFGGSVPADEWNVYLDGDARPLSWLRINAGFRFSLFRVGQKIYYAPEPRLSANFAISPVLSIKTGYARMNQFVQQVSDNYISLPTDYWMPITEDFTPLSSDQISTGLYFSPDDRYVFSVEGYYKWMRNLLEYCDNYKNLPWGTPWSDKLTSGNGRAYGVDFQAEKSVGRLSGFLGYGLLWSDRLFPELNGGRRFPSKYDNRHKLTLSVNYSLSKRVEINGGWTYMTGNRATISLENYQYPGGYPTTIVPTYPNKNEKMLNFYKSKNNIRLPAYHRLDLGITIYCPRKNGHMGVWNVSLYNVYSRMNPIMIEKNNDKQTMGGEHLEPRFRTLALFPIIPSVSYSYKF